MRNMRMWVSGLMGILFFLIPIVAGAQIMEDDQNDVIELPETELIDPALTTIGGTEKYYRGVVVRVLEEREEDLGLANNRSHLQKVLVQIQEGDREGEEVTVEYGSLSEAQKLSEGMRVIVVDPANVEVFIFDRYRLPMIGWIAALCAILVVIFVGRKGLGAMLGLVISIVVLLTYVVPRIIAGANPFGVSVMAALIISVVSIYFAHGFNRRTSVAILSTLVTVVLAMGLAQLFVQWARLTGAGSEEAFFLQTSAASFVNLRGLLLGGIIIGVLGILDDITTAQAAAVDEIWQTDPTIARRELYRRGASVGREHITSLINTLALAYAGASFPALLLFTIYERPWWVVANTENIAEEIIRTLVGSIALMAAVPITTLLAVYLIPKRRRQA